MHLSEGCIHQFLQDHKTRFAKRTMEGYETTIKQLLTFYEKPFNEISSVEIRHWLIYLGENGLKVGTIINKVKGLRLFYYYCVEEGFIKDNPIEGVPYPKEERKLPYYLTSEQLLRLRDLCKGNLKQRAVVEVLYSTGVRVSELTSMKLKDINWPERKIRIPMGKGEKERLVFFTKECAEHLKVYLGSRNDDLPFVFLNRNGTEPFSRYSIVHWFRTFRENLDFYLTAHTLRHTFAANLAMKGMSLSCIQVLLGHTDFQTTQIYARLHQKAQKEMYDQWM
ncbi:tyrosine-type recombinase/integrase [Fictibacillus sp. KU28468]|uniref:tyrosine-type recombinase/integrase n=1 Tax=Fictibacillus sp. KU28468 TaxID=2991053 RepID=UPI00223D5AC6|nr:tyrosine-type recombinase/integrase [Fictibacillus sp. KU28468]UZJ79571.1 tyrosine-type recombinase/integrase [Fictibacillus sp. KU28468]